METPDLNLPVIDTSALVPAGLVNERVNQLARSADGRGVNASEEIPKKQKRSNTNSEARLEAAASGRAQ